jgi:hypothetical protein
MTWWGVCAATASTRGHAGLVELRVGGADDAVEERAVVAHGQLVEQVEHPG